MQPVGRTAEQVENCVLVLDQGDSVVGSIGRSVDEFNICIWDRVAV